MSAEPEKDAETDEEFREWQEGHARARDYFAAQEAARKRQAELDAAQSIGYDFGWEAGLRVRAQEVRALLEALEPFARFFKSDKHDLSPAKDATIVATFLDQTTKEPLAELWIEHLRKAYEACSARDRK